LTAAERVALDALRSLGADTLDESFTTLDLKRAFRALALRYHPDRHPSGSPDQHRALAQAFARVHESYRTLLAHAR
jgi:DnaJ-class molecular chaperone